MGQEKIVIKIQTHFELKFYDKGVYGIHFIHLFSKQGVYLTGADISKQYIQDGMFVIDVDKQMVTHELVGFTSIVVTLINSEKCEDYFYMSGNVISLIGEPTD